MTTKPRQPFASSSSADAPTRTLAAETNPSPRRVGPDGGAVKGTANQLPNVEADRRPAGPLQHPSQVQQSIERAKRDFLGDKEWAFAAAEFIVECDPSPLMYAVYCRTFMNLYARAFGREDLILDLSAGEVN